MSRNQVKRCACGLPLHYRDKTKEAEITKLSAELGEWLMKTGIIRRGDL
jgi:hypothetical protein